MLFGKMSDEQNLIYLKSLIARLDMIKYKFIEIKDINKQHYCTVKQCGYWPLVCDVINKNLQEVVYLENALEQIQYEVDAFPI
jgi:hypothetical protein